MLTASAHGSVAKIDGNASCSTAAEPMLANHRTAAAVAGTEMLSSSRTGMVSTNAATTAATTGARIVNVIEGWGSMAIRVHQASATPPIAPKPMNAAVPAMLLSRFHGSGELRTA